MVLSENANTGAAPLRCLSENANTGAASTLPLPLRRG